MRYFITAIGTGSGKTVASAVCCAALGAEYWKPIQAGRPCDSDCIRRWLPNTIVHPEAFKLKYARSPHAAARAENIAINIDTLSLPNSSCRLVVEGAGGCLVPLNESEFVIDLAKRLDLAVILVVDFYLGSINHTLLTGHFLRHNGYHVVGIIFNGRRNQESEKIVLKHLKYPTLLHIPPLKRITSREIQYYGSKLKI